MGIRTQRELADLIPVDSVTNQTINKWEKGANEPSARYKALLAEALQVDIAYFLAPDPKPETPDLFAGSGDVRLDAILDYTRRTYELLQNASDARHRQQNEILERIERLENALIHNGDRIAERAVDQVRDLVKQPDEVTRALEQLAAQFRQAAEEAEPSPRATPRRSARTAS